ncbi:MAG: NUDIX domain-containing protein [Gemmatimonadota bacterium]|nr:NUDIX domain-containing protein [Gemmatimonadota bacterium]
MSRQPLQVIVIPFKESESVGYQFAVFHRADNSMWQFIAGGAEDDETAEQTARREAEEEAGIPKGARFFRLDSRASVPRTAFSPTKHWSRDIFVVPEYSFAVDVSGQELDLSDEHDQVSWLPFKEATRLLTFESNRIALWELNERLNTHKIDELPPMDDR